MTAKWSEIQDSNDFRSLTPDEQAAAQQRYYNNVISKDPDFLSLGQSEQLATKNRFFSQGRAGRQRQDSRTDQQLLEQLQGKLPSGRPPLSQEQLRSMGYGLPEWDIIRDQRGKAFGELVNRGKTPEQIQFVLGVNKKLDRTPTGRAAGGIIGSIALPLAVGALIPGPVDEAITIPMALAKAARAAAPYVGAGLGGGAGEAIQVGLEEKRLISRGEFLKATGTEILYEAGGRSFVRAGKFAFSPFIKRTIPEAAALVDDFAKLGGVLPPTALDKRFHLSIAEEISRGAFGARQVFQDMGEKSGKAAYVYAEQLLDLMADGAPRLGAEQLGKEFTEGITRPTGFVFRELDNLIDVLYKQLDDMTESQFKRVFATKEVPSTILDELGRPLTKETRKAVGRKLIAKLAPGFEELEEFVPVGVSTRKLKQFWIKELQKNKELLKLGKKGALTLTPDAIKEGERIVFGLEDTIPHRAMRDIRSRVLRDIKKLHRDIGQDEALIKRFERVMFDTLTDPASVKGMNPEMQNLFNNTRNLWAALREGLEKTFPEKLAKRIAQNPSGAIKELFPRNNPSAIRRLRISLVEPIGGRPSTSGEMLWKQLRTAWFDDAVEQATRGGVIKPNVFENIVRRQGKEVIKEMLPDKAGKRQLRNIRDLFVAMSKKPAAGASLFIRGGQVGGLYLMYDGTKDGDFLQVTAGGALVAGPYFFAKMAAHPLGSRLMAAGIKLKPGSTSLVPITARLINLARKLDREEWSAKAKERRKKTVTRHFAEEIKRGRGIKSEKLYPIGLGY